MKLGLIFASICLFSINTMAAPAASAYIKPDTYNYMYPYMNNKMRTDLNPGVIPNQNTNPMDIVVRTTQIAEPRRVVSRPTPTNTARVVTNSPNTATTTQQRGVRQRPNTARATYQNNTYRSANIQTPNRSEKTIAYQTPSTTTNRVSSVRCLADYTTCMDNYCKRENTAYNRCYCSAKLSQIDSMYQPTIEQLITKILTIKNTNTWTDAEMNEYWNQTIGQYTNGNSWINIENALNIDWASMDSRVRGQNAFSTGHEYCIQHLLGCGYMITNLRDAYRSEITRDCATYEQALQKIKNAAESIVESYK